MKYSLLTSLSNYKISEDRNPEENFTTEALCHLLRYSLSIRSELFSGFCELFGKEVSILDYGSVSVYTQRAFKTTDNKLAQPDICIERSKRELIFIEVKVESGINYYQTNEKEIIDQVEKYRRIVSDLPTSICLLTKYIYSENQGNICVRWYEISKLLGDSDSKDQVENYLINNLNNYMKEKRMSIPRVSYELTKGMVSLCNLFEQLELVLEGFAIQKSFGYDWLGYYVLNPNNKSDKIAWIGTFYDGEKISITIENDKLEKVVNEKYQKDFDAKDENGKDICQADFIFEDNCYFSLKAEKQIEVLSAWATRKLELLLKEC